MFLEEIDHGVARFQVMKGGFRLWLAQDFPEAWESFACRLGIVAVKGDAVAAGWIQRLARGTEQLGDFWVFSGPGGAHGEAHEIPAVAFAGKGFFKDGDYLGVSERAGDDPVFIGHQVPEIGHRFRAGLEVLSGKRTVQHAVYGHGLAQQCFSDGLGDQLFLLAGSAGSRFG